MDLHWLANSWTQEVKAAAKCIFWDKLLLSDSYAFRNSTAVLKGWQVQQLNLTAQQRNAALKKTKDSVDFLLKSIDYCGICWFNSVFLIGHVILFIPVLERETHLSYVFKVVVSFLQGSGSVKGFPDSGVFAEESLAVVFYPVHHLDEREHKDHLHNTS